MSALVGAGRSGHTRGCCRGMGSPGRPRTRGEHGQPPGHQPHPQPAPVHSPRAVCKDLGTPVRDRGSDGHPRDRGSDGHPSCRGPRPGYGLRATASILTRRNSGGKELNLITAKTTPVFIPHRSLGLLTSAHSDQRTFLQREWRRGESRGTVTSPLARLSVPRTS